jgi:hypothetical protein
MGKTNQENVRLVISHLEGCSGNFLGKLFSDTFDKDQSFFRIDRTDGNDGFCGPHVLAIDGIANDGVGSWDWELKRLKDHHVVVTHNFDRAQIAKDFPNAKIIQIYPYTHIGNVLYNICFKKLNHTLPNLLDNYLLHINEWYHHIQKSRPPQICTNFWQLSDQQAVENLLETKFTKTQEDFFNQYWKNQLAHELTIPNNAMSIQELVSFWKVEHCFDQWLAAWTIFVYELINQRLEQNRSWSIDTDNFESWNDLEKIQTRYHDDLTSPTD